jgi:metal-sulfur cluster biosynthetic enzyme
MPTIEEVRDVLRDVQDPELHMGIVDLGLVYGIDVAGEKNENVTVTMTLTSPMCPVGPMFKESVKTAVSEMYGVESTEVQITFEPPWDPREMASDDVKVQLGIW